MKKKTRVNISQFIAMIPVEVASNFIMEFVNSDKILKTSGIKEYFSGDICCPHEFVLRAFSWDTTIKGVDYWYDVCHNLHNKYGGGVTFSEFIEMLEPIERHRLNNAIEKQRGEGLLNEMYSDNVYNIDPTEWLQGVIAWDDTDEGGKYWADICNRLDRIESLNEPSMLN
jgi:hypothetical protein